MKVKFCGMKRREDIEYVNQCKPDYIGYIFAQSKRQIDISTAVELTKQLDLDIIPVGVFVNAPISLIYESVIRGAVRMVQLHGDEDEDYIAMLKKRIHCPIIKAVAVREKADIAKADVLPCDYLLLDTYHKELAGGTGEGFDWDNISSDIKHPFFLAGGIDMNNVTQAMDTKADVVDISSGIETDGYKDLVKMQMIINKIRKREENE